MKLLARDYLQPLRKHPSRLADLLTCWYAFAAKGILVNPDGSLQATLHLVGPDLRQQPEGEQGAAIMQLTNAIRQLGDHGVSLHSHSQHLKMPPPPVPDTYQHPTARLLAQERYNRWVKQPLFETEHHLSIRYQPISPGVHWLKSVTYKPGDTSMFDKAAWRQHLTPFKAMMNQLLYLLQGVMVDVQPMDNRALWNYLYGFLRFSRGHDLDLPEILTGLAHSLDGADFEPGDIPRYDGQYIRVFTISDYPRMTYAAMLALLADSDVEHDYILRWIPTPQVSNEKWFSKLKAKSGLHKRKMWTRLLDRGFGHAEGRDNAMADENMGELSAAEVELGSGHMFGANTVIVVVRDPSEVEAERKIRRIEAMVMGRGIKGQVEHDNTLGAWLGGFPCMNDTNPRDPKVKEINAVHLLPVDAPYSGERWDPHWNVPPLFVARTAVNKPYRFVPFPWKDAAGHILGFGRSGMGKSAFLHHFRVAAQVVPELQDIGEDFKASSKPTTLALHGQFDDLGAEGIQHQPFRYIDDPEQRRFYHEWLLTLLADHGIAADEVVTPFTRGALDRLSEVELSGRTWSGLIECMAPQSRGLSQVKLHYADEHELKRREQVKQKVRDILKPMRSGIFDGSVDSIRLSQVQTFELETLFKTPRQAKPVMRHVHYQVFNKLDGRPTLYWFDEVNGLFDDAESTEKLELFFRRVRDKNVLLMAFSQNIEDFMEHPLAKKFADNSETLVFFPDKQALAERNQRAYASLGLGYEHTLQLHSAPPGHYIVKNSRGTRLVEHYLDPIAKAVVGRTGRVNLAKCDEILREVGPQRFPGAWVKSAGFQTEADWLDAQIMGSIPVAVD